MTIFGSGRREGILAVFGLAVFALSVHAVGFAFGLAEGFEGDLALARGMEAVHRVAAEGGIPLWDQAGAGAPLWARGAEMLYPPWWLLGRGHDAFWLPALAAMHAAIACALAFRLLRTQGCSRYSSFVCAAAYGLGAHPGRMSGSLPELAALAWAPLVLELLLRVVRGERQKHLAPLLGPSIAWMFSTGGVATAATVLAVAVAWYVAWAWRERHRTFLLLGTGLLSLGIAAAMLAPMWLAAIELPIVASPTTPRVDVMSNARLVCGPLLLFFALLGAMRRQRGAPTGRWIALALVGAAFAILLPFVPSPLHGEAPWQRTPDALWWPVHFALVLLACNGLDDFLDMPLRRRAATVWTLVLAVVVAPIGFVLGEHGTWLRVEGAVVLALAILFLIWRALGILRFKTVVAAAALVWLAVATLREEARAGRSPFPLPTLARVQPHPWLFATPVGETGLPAAPISRARIVFDLQSDDDPERAAAAAAATANSTPAPVQHARTPTLVHALPSWFVPRADENATAEFLGETSMSCDYRAHLPSGAGALVVDDTWTPGWRSYVDGREVECLSTGEGARAVLLDSGMHMVRFEYRPLVQTIGIQLAVGASSFVGVWSLFSLLRLFFSSRKNTAVGLRTKKTKKPANAARPAIATKAMGGETS